METETDERVAEDATTIFDLETAGREIGATDLQIAYVRNRILGMNKTRAAKAAGYSGDGGSLRSVAVKVEKSPAVQTLLRMADERGAGLPDMPHDRATRKKLFAKLMHGADKHLAVKAMQELEKIEREESEEGTSGVAGDPMQTLEAIATIDPRYAMKLAKDARFEPSATVLQAAKESLRKYHCIACAALVAHELGIPLEEIAA